MSTKVISRHAPLMLLHVLALFNIASAQLVVPFVDTTLSSPAVPRLVRMNLTRTQQSQFDPVQAAIQLGIKYGAGSSSGGASVVASLAKQIELLTLSNGTDTETSDGPKDGYSVVNNTAAPVQLHSTSQSFHSMAIISHPEHTLRPQTTPTLSTTLISLLAIPLRRCDINHPI